MKSNFLLLIFLFFLLTTGGVFAQGEAALPFLLIDPSAKGNGMAGAMTSVSHDASASYYNPACLVRTKRFSGETNRLTWMPVFYNELNYHQTSEAFNIPKYGWFGLNFIYFDLGESVWTDETGAELSTFHSYEWATSIGYAYRYSNSTSFGINLKLIQSNLPDKSVGTENQDGKLTTYAFDIGFLQQNILKDYSYRERFLNERLTKWSMHRQPPGISVGLSISNIGPKIKYIDRSQADPLPQNLRLGISWNYMDTDVISLITSIEFNKLLVKKDTMGRADPFYKAGFTSWSEGGLNSITTGIGQQISIMTLFAMRIGYFYEDPGYGGRKYLSYGFSYGPETLRINTAWIWDWRYDDKLVKDKFMIGFSVAY